MTARILFFCLLVLSSGCRTQAENPRAVELNMYTHSLKYFPEKITCYPCQEAILCKLNRSSTIRADFLLEIKNNSSKQFVFPEEEFVYGFFGLEFDLRLKTGRIYSIRRKTGVWTRNFLSIVNISPMRQKRWLVSLDSDLWENMPNLSEEDTIWIRPRLANGSLVETSENYLDYYLCNSNYYENIHNVINQRENEIVGRWIAVRIRDGILQ